MADCDLCTAPLGDTATICSPCTGTLRAALRAVAGDGRLHGLDVDLDIATAKQAVFPRQQGVGRRRGRAAAALPIDTTPAEAAGVLRSTLAAWCRALLDAQPEAAPVYALAAMATWLEERAETIRHRADAAACVDEVRAAVGHARWAVDRPPERVYVGECPECGQRVYDQAGRAIARCRTEDCRGVIEDPDAYRAERARQAAAAAPDHMVTAAEGALAARAMGYQISERWIRKLAADGRLAPAGEGRPAKYRLGDILNAATVTHQKAS